MKENKTISLIISPFFSLDEQHEVVKEKVDRIIPKSEIEPKIFLVKTFRKKVAKF